MAVFARHDRPPARRAAPGVRRILTVAAVAVLLVGCTGGSPGSAGASGPPATGPVQSVPAAPPDAVLVLPDGRTVTGVLGSYSFGDRGSDAPWIGAGALRETAVPPGAEVRIRFADGSRIGAWNASLADAADVTGSSAAGIGGREEPTPPVGEISTGPPPAGRHVLGVHLILADGRGDGMYFWLLRSDD